MLDNGYVYLAACRLSCFCGETGWAIVFEVFGYSPRAGVPDLFVTSIGEGIQKTETREGFGSEQAFENFESLNEFWRQDVFHPFDDDGWIDHEAMDVMFEHTEHCAIRGNEVPAPSREQLDEVSALGGVRKPYHVSNVIRALAEDHRTELLATEAERRSRIPDQWDCLVTLEEWNHPDVVHEVNRPSTSQTMRSLAEAIVNRDPSRCEPERPNTHWSNWPDGGTL